MNQNVQSGPVVLVSQERCTCSHLKEDHSDRPDQQASAVVPKRPWCHACSSPCNYRRRSA